MGLDSPCHSLTQSTGHAHQHQQQKKKKKKPRKSVGRCLIPYPDAVGAHRFLSRKKPLHQFRRLFGLDLTSQHFTNLRHKVVSYSIFIERGIGIDFTCRQAMFLLYDL